MMIGAKDLAFPAHQSAELVHLHHWRRSSCCYSHSHRRRRHRLDLLHAVQHRYSNTHVVDAAIGIFIAGFSSILTGLNFIVTIHRMRAPGMTWSRLPLFIWSHYATSIIMVLGTPVLAITLLLVALERALPHRHLRSAAAAATRCSSSTCSGSIRILRCTS